MCRSAARWRLLSGSHVRIPDLTQAVGCSVETHIGFRHERHSPRSWVPQLSLRQALADHLFEAVLSLILDGEVPTGSALSIDGLAKRFDVSSTPVREALARLEATGMVRREAHRGYKVAPSPTASDIDALMTTRQVLEPENTFLACQNATPDFISDLNDINQELEQTRGGDTFAGYRAYWKADGLFHRRIAEGAGNEFLLQAYGSVEGHIQWFRLLVHSDDVSAEPAVQEHQTIIGAFQANDAAGARDAMSAHIDGIRSRSAKLTVFNKVDVLD